jgi:Ca2+-binding RTX toxin-like protein
MPTFNDYLALSSAVYQDGSQIPLTWTSILRSPENSSGYQGEAFFNAVTNEIVLVNRGTDELTDLVSDAQILLDFKPNQYNDAEGFYNQVREEAILRGATLSIAGHSLGGSLTQLLVANHAGDSFNGQPLSGVTFNALGAESLLNDYGVPVNAAYNVTNFVTPTDPVGNVRDHIGTVDTSLPIPPFNVPSVILPPAFLVNVLLDSHEVTSIPEGFLIQDVPTEPSEFTVVGDQLIQTFVKDRGFGPDINGVVLLGGNEDELGLTIDGGSQNDLLFGSNQHDLLNGQVGDDVLYGGDGHDTLIGNSGADIMLGEAGDDTYVVENSGDRVIEAVNEGIDTVISEVSFTLLDNVENLVLTGAAAIGGTGNELDNVLTGNDAANELTGGTGADALYGGVGSDLYLYRTGDGADTILDADQKGSVIYDNRLLQGGIRKPGDASDTYRSTDGQFTYRVTGSDLVVNGTLTIKDFTSGQLGITLVDPVATATRTTYLQEVTNPTPPPPTHLVPIFDDLNNVYLDADGEHDLIHALGGDDVVYGGPGEDQLYGDAGNDQLIGNGAVGAVDAENDYLDGGDGNDLLQGGGGADVVLGGAGNDNLNGDVPTAENLGHNDDWLDGGAGDDQLHGAAGNDVLVGGLGSDLLIGDTTQFQGGTPEAGGADTLDGGDGDDQLYGLYGDDLLAGGFGNDRLNGQDGDDVLYGGDGNDTLSGDLRISPLTGKIDTSEFRGAGGNDLLDGGAGFDFLQGGEGDDVLVGGAEDDTLYGDYNPNLFPAFTYQEITGANDTLNGTALVWGNDVLEGGEGDDELEGGDGDDVLDGGTGADFLDGGDGIDRLSGGEGDDFLRGGDGEDTLDGGTGNDRLDAADAGNDTVFGGDGDDTLIGGNEYFASGTPTLIGGAGNDTYIVDSQADTVIEEAGSGVDTIESFASYTLGDHVENLTLHGFNNVGIGNELDNVLRNGGTLDGRAGNDTLIGNGRLDGGTGNDILIGGSSTFLGHVNGIPQYESNTYVFGRGYGQDRVQEYNEAVDLDHTQNDVVEMAADVSPNDVTWQRNHDDLVFTINGTADQLTVNSYFNVVFNSGMYLFNDRLYIPPGGTVNLDSRIPYYFAPSQVEQVRFADGTTWGPETFGMPTIGGYHGDTYDFGSGAGAQTLLDFNGVIGTEADVVRMAPDVSPDEATVGRTGNDLTLSVDGTDDQLTVQSHFATVFARESFSFSGRYVNPYQIERVEFAGGTVWDPSTLQERLVSITGTDEADNIFANANDNVVKGLDGDDVISALEGDDVLDGGAGNDQLYGGEGNDLYLFDRGDGQDTVYNEDFSGSEFDRVRLGADILPTDVTVQAGSYSDLDLTINGTMDKITLADFFGGPAAHVDQVEFADGTIWDVSTLLERASGLSISGTEEDDYLSGSSLGDFIEGLGGADYISAGEGDDILDGGTGEDVLIGDPGSDLYLFNLGDGQDIIYEYGFDVDTVRLGAGILPGDVTVQVGDYRSDLDLTINGTMDKITLAEFFSGPRYQVDQVEFADGTVWDVDAILAHGPGTDQIGTEDADVLEGSPFNDRLTGLGGDDFLIGGTGADTLDGGAGNDELRGEGGNDILEGGAGNDVLAGGTGEFGGGGEGEGGGSADSGDDLLVGGKGDDTYLFNFGDGVDTIVDTAVPGEGNRIRFGEEITQADLTFEHDATTDTLNIQVGFEGDALRLTNFDPSGVNGSLVVETLEFADGSQVALTDLFGPVGPVATEGDDVLTGTPNDDVIDALAGNDLVDGLEGNDALIGGPGNDRLIGGVGADQLTGGTGDDTFVVDDAGDQVIEAADEGTDTVESSISYVLGSNVENLILTGAAAVNGTGNAFDNVLVGNDAANVLDGGAGADTMIGGAGDDTYLVDSDRDVVSETVGVGGGADSVRSSANTSLGDHVENLTLVGNGDLTGTGNELANVLIGNDGANVLSGDAGDDMLVGGIGNDTLIGGSGDDTYQFNLGDGVDRIVDTAAPGEGNTLVFGAEITEADLSLGLGSLLIRVGSNSDAIHLETFDPHDAYGLHAIDTFQFADGMVLSYSQLIDRGFDLTGTDGDDQIIGTNVVDRISGFDGQDVLQAGDGSDVLDGGIGNDALDGGIGNDSLTGGTGNDRLDGGTGDDLYRYALGDGLDRITDAAGLDTVIFGDGLSFDHTVVRLHEEAGVTTANLRLLDEQGNELADQGMGFALGIDGSSPIEQFAFADGTTVSLDDLVIRTVVTEGTRRGDVIRTGRHDDIIYAGNGGDRVYAGSGHDTVYAGRGGDSVFGEAGHDTLYGDNGRDLLDGGYGNDLLDGGKGDDTLLGGDGHDRLLGGHGEDWLESGTGDDVLDGNKGDDTLLGGEGNDALWGGSGADCLVGGTGDDQLDSGKGEDVVFFGRGDGHDTLIGREHNHGDTVQFGPGIKIEDLWFMRDGNNLTVSLLGSSGPTDRLTIADWYTDKRNQIDEFRTAGGCELEGKQVEQLRQAMAAFAPPAPSGQIGLPPSMPAALEPVLAAAWEKK